MNLELLNLSEQKLLLRVGNVTGLMEEKFLQLEQNGVFSDYNEIYESYVDLIESETEWLEALKRSIFLLWFEQSEPSCFSGLSDLSTSTSRKVFRFLERQIEINKIDPELKLMLHYYNEISDWVFDELVEWVFEQKQELPNLQMFLANTNREVAINELNAENFRDRGQMGKYWISISQSNNFKSKN